MGDQTVDNHRMIPIGGGKQVPIGTLYCVGRNYAAHAEEMKEVVPARPLVFLKPPAAVIRTGQTVIRPSFSSEMHHEVELVAVIAREVRGVSIDDASDVIGGYAVGLDMTLRDVQSEAKKNGTPWAVAKGFDTSAPLGPIIDREDFIAASEAELGLKLLVNGEPRQHAGLSTMVVPVPDLVAYLSSIFTLRPGDLIYTGTPSGVGPVEPGDVMDAEITGIPGSQLSVRVAES